jgi:FMN-dependent NADH-azoreductase
VTPTTTNKSLVVLYSCGAGDDALLEDHLGNYIKIIFSLVGFTDCHELKIEGVVGRSGSSRNHLVKEVEERSGLVAAELNSRFK